MVSFHDFIALLIIFNHGKIRFSPLSKNVDMSPDSGQGYEAEGKCGVKSVKSTKRVCIDYPKLP